MLSARCLAVLLLCSALLPVAPLRAQEAELPLAAALQPGIPQPPELEPDVRFWMRVYSEVSTNEGFVHDARDLAVVYETLHFAPDAPPAQRQQQVSAARERYQSILRRLSSGAPPEGDEEQRVRSLWREADDLRLGLAADDVRFQLGQSDRFRAGLVRAGTWESHIAQSLAALGLPREIAVLPHVESSFQPEAMSKAGAAGLWQFIRSTGRRFLRIDRAVDERLDPYRATEAAAQLLAYNYRVLGTWPLAITAYNHGAAGMRRAREQLGTDDIVRIVRDYHSPSFGFASRNYYASFLAALRLDREPEKYFGALQRRPDTPSFELALPQATRIDVLQKALGVELATLRSLNPALRAPVWNRAQAVPRGYHLRLPLERADLDAQQLLARLTGPPPQPGASAAAAPAARPDVASAAQPLPAPATASVARTRRAAAPVAVAGALAPASGVVVAGAAEPVVATAEPLVATAEPLYVVRRGDSVAAIAVAAGLEPERLLRLNGLSAEDRIYEGQQLLTADPAGEANSEVEAARAAAEDRLDAQRAAAALTAERAAPALSAAQAQAVGPRLLPASAAPANADPIDYGVDEDNSVRVVAAETLGHYADWLGVPAATLRELNELGSRSSVQMGRRLKLVFTHATREQFERRRRQYHQQLQSAFFATHRIAGTMAHIAQKGDTLWGLTRRGALPDWLLQQYNPDVDFADLRPGTQVLLPVIVDAL
jgi:membrane-bound lytic murein transglycosylase D